MSADIPIIQTPKYLRGDQSIIIYESKNQFVYARKLANFSDRLDSQLYRRSSPDTAIGVFLNASEQLLEYIQQKDLCTSEHVSDFSNELCAELGKYSSQLECLLDRYRVGFTK